jgi:hypothetical protein
MKKLKLIFGLLIVAAFFLATAMSTGSSDEQALRKRPGMILPTWG